MNKIKKVKIRENARVSIDMHIWLWPHCPYGDIDIAFNITEGPYKSVYQLTAAKFGQSDDYGNGSVIVHEEDLIEN